MDEQKTAQQASENQPQDGELPPSAPLPPTKKTSILRLKNTWLFVGGFLGWFLVNITAYWLALLLGAIDKTYAVNLSCLLIPANVVLFVVLVFIQATRQIAWGMLTAIGLNILISQLLGLSLNVYCMIPFIFKNFEPPQL